MVAVYIGEGGAQHSLEKKTVSLILDGGINY
jgi:hypothetical protein